jgi:hypothetical protein
MSTFTAIQYFYYQSMPKNTPNNESILTKHNFTAFTNAKFVTQPKSLKETLLIQNGKVIAAGATVVIPKIAQP